MGAAEHRNDASPRAFVRFTLGEWNVDASAHELRRGDARIALEPRQMAVLAALCRHAGQVLSPDELLDLCWPGQAVGDNPVHKAIAALRRVLDDSPTAPRYIETIRKQGYRLIAPTRVLSDEGARSHGGGWRGTSPFRGLEAFDDAHASVFFGRDGPIALLRERLQTLWRGGHGLLLLLGPSGSGKTSLVQAGLLPALAAAPASQGHGLRPCATAVVDLGAHDDSGAWGALAGGLLDWDIDGVPLLAGHSVATLAQAMQTDRRGALQALDLGLQAHAIRAADTPPLLVLDRLEALFQAPLAGHAAPFVEALEALLASGLLMVLAICRNDFYAGLASHRLFMAGKACGGHVDLEPVDADATAQIIRLPARAAGLVYATDPSGLHRLDDRLCADAMKAPDALPLLQYTLQSLYLARAPGDVLTWEAYDALGGLEGAVGQRAEAVLAALPPAQQAALARLLPRLVGPAAGEAGASTRWMRESEFTGADERALAQALVQARLLVADRVGGVAGMRIAHEALLRRWPRVVAWIAQHREMLAARDDLLVWLQRWRDGGRLPSLLLPVGATLWRAAGAAAQAPQLFTDEERLYVTRSQARLRRQARLRWAAVAAVATLAIVAALAAARNAQLARIAAERELQSQRLASFMLGEFADQLRPLGKLELLARVGEQGLSSLGHAGAETPADALQRAKALVVIGEVNSSRGKDQLGVALPALRSAEAALAPLEQASGIARGDYYKTLGSAAFWSGQIAFDAGDTAAAEREMMRYLEACQHWQLALPDDPAARTELSFAYGSLGSVAFSSGDWARATRWFEASLELKLAALATHPNEVEAIETVATARNWLGELAYIQGQPRRALALYDQADGALRLQLKRDPNRTKLAHDLGILVLRRAESLRALGRQGEAGQAYDETVATLAAAAARDPANRRWKLEALHAQAIRVLWQLESGQVAAAGLAALHRQMAEEHDDRVRADYLWQLAGSAVALADAEAAALAGQADRATASTTEAGRLVRDLQLQRPHDWRPLEMQAGLTLFRLQRRDAPAITCDDDFRRLDSAVQAGQAGVVYEAWLAARRCARRADPDRAERQRLTAGGYRPVSPLLSTSSNPENQP